MFNRKIIFFLCLGLLLLSNPGAGGQTSSNTQTHSSPKSQTDTLHKSIEMTDIHDIKSLEKFGINPAIFWYAALGAIVLMLTAAIISYLKKRQKKVPEVMASISPEDTALGLLDDLQLLMDIDGKKFYFNLSIILREYIWRRFSVGAPEMTTEELLPRIAELDIDSGLAQGVKEFARSSDPVKFADQPAEVDKMKRHIEFVRSFVHQTTPVSVTIDENKINDSVSQELTKT